MYSIRSKADLSLLFWACKSWIQASSCHNLTADVEKVGEEEGLLVELLNGQDYRPIQAAPQSLLWATLVCYKGLQHGPHHVKLWKKKQSTCSYHPAVRHHCTQLQCSAIRINTSSISYSLSELEIITPQKKETLGTVQQIRHRSNI